MVMKGARTFYGAVTIAQDMKTGPQETICEKGRHQNCIHTRMKKGGRA